MVVMVRMKHAGNTRLEEKQAHVTIIVILNILVKKHRNGEHC